MSSSPDTSDDPVKTGTGVRVVHGLLIVAAVFAVGCLSYSFLVFLVVRDAVGALPYVAFDERFFWWPLCAGLLSLALVGVGIVVSRIGSRSQRTARR